MDAEAIKAQQAPIKARYKDDPSSALFTLRAEGRIGSESLTCKIETAQGIKETGLHEATGGDGLSLCSGDLLLESLVGCAGVTLRAVAAAMGLDVPHGRIIAEGVLDFRGTLGVSKEVPVGFSEIRLKFDLETDAPAESIATLIRLTERYCVVYQTLRQPPRFDVVTSRSPVIAKPSE